MSCNLGATTRNLNLTPDEALSLSLCLPIPLLKAGAPKHPRATGAALLQLRVEGWGFWLFGLGMFKHSCFGFRGGSEGELPVAHASGINRIASNRPKLSNALNA